jgi:hypothetical protein
MTNPRSTSIIPIAVVLAAACFGLGNPAHIDAVPSQMSHEMSGTVQRIDRQSLTIVLTGESKPGAFAWNSKDTKFFHDGAPTTIDSLHAGTYVGSGPLLYRVSWQTRSSPKK